MEEYRDIADACHKSIVTYDAFLEHAPMFAETVDGIWENNKHRTVEDVIAKCLVGAPIEIGIYQWLNTPNLWTRFSRQITSKDKQFDLECLSRKLFLEWDPKAARKIDGKSSNIHCEGEYFAFNCYDKWKNEEAFNEQHRRPGANLNFFINHAHDTPLLLTASSREIDIGWEITPKYLIHRDAFVKYHPDENGNRLFPITKYKSSPYYWLRYSQMILDGHCIKLQG